MEIGHQQAYRASSSLCQPSHGPLNSRMGTQAKAKQSWENRGLLSDIKIQGELDKLRTHTSLCEWEEKVP